MPEVVLIEFIGDAKSGVAAADAQVAANERVAASTKSVGAASAAAVTPVGQLGTATEKTGKATRKSTGLFNEHGKVTSKVGSIYGNTAKAAGGLIAAYAGFEALKSAVDFTDELVHNTQILTNVTGLNAKSASQWVELAKQRELATSKLTIGFSTLSKQIRGAETGSSTAAKGFHALGIPLKELRHLSTEEVLLKISNGLKNTANYANKAALTQQFFGKSGRELLPIIGQGSKALQSQLQSFSGLSEAQQKAGEEAREFKRKISRFYDEMRIKVSFAMLDAGKAVAKWIKEIGEGKTDIAKTIQGIGRILGNVLKNYIDAAVQIFKGFAQVIKGICEVIQGVLHLEFGKAWQGIKDIFGGGVKGTIGIMHGILSPLIGIAESVGDKLGPIFSDIWDGIRNVFESGVNDVIGFINDLISAINAIPGIPDIGAVGLIGAGASFTNRKEAKAAVHHQHRARGGPIFEGAPSGDTVPAMLERGEYVLNKKAVAKVGRGKLDAINFHEAPRFAFGGPVGEAVGSVASSVGKAVTGTLGDALASLPTPHLPGWIAGVGSYLLKGVSDYITGGFQEKKFGKLVGPTGGVRGPKGVGTYMGIPMANWVIESLQFAAAHGSGNPQPTSGYRPGFDPFAPSGSEHAKTQYPGGAVDFGGFHDAAAKANKMAVVRATAGFKYPLLAPIGFVDDGHASGTGHQLGGLIGLAKGGGTLGKSLSKQGQSVHELMQSVWPFAAPFFGRSAESPPPRANLDSSVYGGAYVGDVKVFGKHGALKKNYLAYPKWFEGWIGKKPNVVKENLLHEWAHYFQDSSISRGPSWEAEGGAEAFARWAAPQVYAAAGIPYQNPPFPKSELYFPYVQHVLKDKGMDWVEHGQFGGDGGSTKKLMNVRRRHRHHKHPAPFAQPPIWARQNLMAQAAAPGWMHGSSILSADQMATLAHHVGAANPGLMSQIGEAESGGNPRAMGGAGDKGLWQIIPSTASAFGIDYRGLFDPLNNAEGMKKVLDGQGLTAWSTYNSGAYAGEPKGKPLGVSAGAGTAAKVKAIPKALKGLYKEKIGTIVKGGFAKVTKHYDVQTAALSFGGVPGSIEDCTRELVLRRHQLHEYRAAARNTKDKRVEKALKENAGRLLVRIKELVAQKTKLLGERRKAKAVRKIAARGTLPVIERALQGFEGDHEKRSEYAEQLGSLEPEEQGIQSNFASVITSYIEGQERPAWEGVLGTEASWRNTLLSGEILANEKISGLEFSIKQIEALKGKGEGKNKNAAWKAQKWRIPRLREAIATMGESKGEWEEQLGGLQGLSGPSGFLGSLPGDPQVGLSQGFGGTIFGTEMSIHELGIRIRDAQAANEPEKNTALEEALKAMAETAQKEKALAELQYGPLSEFLRGMPPYLGAFAKGGPIPSDGMAMVHKGEYVVPANEVGNGSQAVFNLHLHGDMANAVDSAMPGMVKEVDRRMGTRYRHIVYAPGGRKR